MLHTLILLLGWHALADFPLQGDYVAKYKHPWLNGGGNRDWVWVMGSHCMIHAVGVYLITGSLWLGLCEFWLHGLIDVVKCRGKMSFHEDQFCHILCKGAWALLA